jgi:hypothetical protein
MAQYNSRTLPVRWPAPMPVSSLAMLLSVLCLGLTAMAQYPGACVLPGAFGLNSTCCPEHPHTGLACGGAERGVCTVANDAGYAPVSRLERMRGDRWRPFERVCNCRPHFFGAACEFCEPGYTGVNCTQRHLRERKDFFSELTEDERQVRHQGARYVSVRRSGPIRLKDPFHYGISCNIFFASPSTCVRLCRPTCRPWTR